MKEADVVRTQDAGDEGCDVSFADGFLLVRLEHLNGDGVDERRLPTIDFACLVEEVLERCVCLAVFRIATSHDLLDLWEAGFGYGVDELRGLGTVSMPISTLGNHKDKCVLDSRG